MMKFFNFLLVGILLLSGGDYSALAQEFSTAQQAFVDNDIQNPGAETGIKGFSRYADAAAVSPVDGTSGVPTVTLAASTSSPLKGGRSFLFTKDAANRQGQGFSYDFTVGEGEQGRVQKVSFLYSTSANYVDGDMRVYVYDRTNSTLIEVVDRDISANSFGHFIGSYQTSSNSTSYRLIFHVSSTSALSYTLKVDSLKHIGSSSHVVKGPVVTDPKTETATSSWSTNVTNTVTWHRVGKYMYAKFNTLASGSVGTPGTLAYVIPNGHQIDTVYQAITFGDENPAVSIRCQVRDAGTASFPCHARMSGATQVSIVYTDDGASGVMVPNVVNHTTPFTWASGDSIEVEIKVPIVGWSSNSVLSSEDGGQRLIATRATLTSNQSISTTSETTIIFNSAPLDKTASFNTSTGTWTCPESGVFPIIAQLMPQSLALGDNTIIRIKKNGTAIHQENIVVIAADNNQTHTVATVQELVKGDAITVTIDSGADASYAITGTTPDSTMLTIWKLSSPQTLAASETVNARYTSNSGQAVSTSPTIIKYEDLVYDSHNAYSVSTGLYSSPMSGKYKVCAKWGSANFTSTSGQVFKVFIYKNGAEWSRQSIVVSAVTNGNFTPNYCDDVSVARGDTIAAYGEAPSATTIESGSSLINIITIDRVGN